MTEDGKFTVEEYQEMVTSGQIKSGAVALLPPLNGPVSVGRYRTRDGGEVTIGGFANNIQEGWKFSSDGTVMWGSNGAWYEATTGRIINESQFHGLHKLLGGVS